MIENIDRHFFADKEIAHILHDVEYYFTTLEDNGHIIICDCRYIKPKGIAHIVYHPSMPSNHYLAFEELNKHTVSFEQYSKYNEKKQSECAVLILVTIKESGIGDIVLSGLIEKLQQRNMLLKEIYLNNEPVYSEGVTIKSHMRLVIMKKP